MPPCPHSNTRIVPPLLTHLLNLSPILLPLVTKAYSTSTWNARARVLRSIIRDTPVRVLSKTKILRLTLSFLQQRSTELLLGRIKPLTVSRDISHIRWLLQVLGVDPIPPAFRTLLSLLQRGLTRTQSTTKVVKALPLNLRMLENLTSSAPLHVAVTLQLAFHTSSRFSDLLDLRKESFILASPRGILVLFGMTKTNPTAERRADHQLIIEPAPEILLRNFDKLHSFLRLTNRTMLAA